MVADPAARFVSQPPPLIHSQQAVSHCLHHVQCQNDTQSLLVSSISSTKTVQRNDKIKRQDFLTCKPEAIAYGHAANAPLEQSKEWPRRIPWLLTLAVEYRPIHRWLMQCKRHTMTRPTQMRIYQAISRKRRLLVRELQHTHTHYWQTNTCISIYVTAGAITEAEAAEERTFHREIGRYLLRKDWTAQM